MPLGILVSAGGVGLNYYFTKVKNEKVCAKKATYIIGIIAVVLSVILIAGGYPNNTQKPQDSTNNQEQTIQSENKQNGKLMFVLTPEGDIPENLVFQVCVNGKTSEGESVDNDYDATVGTKYQLDNTAGEYEIKVRTTSLTQNEVVYSVPTAKVNFDGEKDYTAELKVTVDQEAISALAEKKKKEEEEKAAAEAKQKEEQEKAAAEQQQQQQQQQQESSTNNSSTNDNMTVWVTASGKKYHIDGCRTIKSSKNLTSMTKAEAKAQGYTACGVCSPG